MVGSTNGCEGVNIVIVSVVHLSKFRCFFIHLLILLVVGAVFLCSSHCRAIAGCP